MDSVFDPIDNLLLVHVGIWIAVEVAAAPETRGYMYVDITSTAHSERLNRDKPSGKCACRRFSLGINFYAARLS